MEDSGSTRLIASEEPGLGDATPLTRELMLAPGTAHIGEGLSLPLPAPATAAFFPGMSMEADQAGPPPPRLSRSRTDLPRLASADLAGFQRNSRTGRLAVGHRGTVFRCPSSGDTTVHHLSTGDMGVMSASDFPPLQRQFKLLRGELMHCFISYRVASEGPEGNRLSGSIAAKIRSLSLDIEQGLQIPHHGR